MRKGKRVRLSVDKCFTVDAGGKLHYPLTNYVNDEDGVINGFYKMSPEERDEWRDQFNAEVRAGTRSALDCAGESVLTPREGRVPMHRDRTYTVVRARARTILGYHMVAGLMVVLDSMSGREIFVKRDLMELAE